MYKNDLRKCFLEKRNKFDDESIKNKSKIILKTFCKTDSYINSKIIFTYININSEVSTKELIEKAWADKKDVAVPVTGKNRCMYFAKIKSFDNLYKTSFGTFEPREGICNEFIPNKSSIFIVPGAVFDIYKNRLGYGGGYYDTYFSKHNGFQKIAFAYDFQVINTELPYEKHDEKMDLIVTESKIIS